MTTNQLKYWELRWKQHYENILAKIKEQELLQQWAKLEEERRSNRMDERIRWAQLQESIRAAVVAEGLKKESNAIDALRANSDLWYKQVQAQDLLAKQEIASAEFALSFEQAKNADARAWLDTEAKLLKNGWSEYAVGKAIGEAKAGMSDSRYNALAEQLSQSKTVLGNMMAKYVDALDIKPYVNPADGGTYSNPTNKSPVIRSPGALNLQGPGIVTGTSDKGVSVSMPSNATRVSTGATVIAPNNNNQRGPIVSKTSAGTKVISSPSVASRNTIGPGV